MTKKITNTRINAVKRAATSETTAPTYAELLESEICALTEKAERRHGLSREEIRDMADLLYIARHLDGGMDVEEHIAAHHSAQRAATNNKPMPNDRHPY